MGLFKGKLILRSVEETGDNSPVTSWNITCDLVKGDEFITPADATGQEAVYFKGVCFDDDSYMWRRYSISNFALNDDKTGYIMTINYLYLEGEEKVYAPSADDGYEIGAIGALNTEVGASALPTLDDAFDITNYQEIQNIDNLLRDVKTEEYIVNYVDEHGGSTGNDDTKLPIAGGTITGDLAVQGSTTLANTKIASGSNSVEVNQKGIATVIEGIDVIDTKTVTSTAAITSSETILSTNNAITKTENLTGNLTVSDEKTLTSDSTATNKVNVITKGNEAGYYINVNQFSDEGTAAATTIELNASGKSTDSAINLNATSGTINLNASDVKVNNKITAKQIISNDIETTNVAETFSDFIDGRYVPYYILKSYVAENAPKYDDSDLRTSIENLSTTVESKIDAVVAKNLISASIVGLTTDDIIASGDSNNLYVNQTEKDTWNKAASDITNKQDILDLTVFQYKAEKGQADGYAPLNSDAKIDSAYLPYTFLTSSIDINEQTDFENMLKNNKLEDKMYLVYKSYDDSIHRSNDEYGYGSLEQYAIYVVMEEINATTGLKEQFALQLNQPNDDETLKMINWANIANVPSNLLYATTDSVVADANLKVMDGLSDSNTFDSVTVDKYGRVTAGVAHEVTNALAEDASDDAKLTFVTLNSNNKIDAAYIPSQGSTGLDDQTNLTPGTYNTVTVDQKGIVTTASNVDYVTKDAETGKISVTDLSEHVVLTDNENKISASIIPDSVKGTTLSDIFTEDDTKNFYNNVKVNAKGIVTAVQNTSYITAGNDGKIADTYLSDNVITVGNLTSNLPDNLITTSNIADQVSANLPNTVVQTGTDGKIADSVLSDNVTTNLLKDQADLTAGTYNNVTVNKQGIITKAENKTYLEELPSSVVQTNADGKIADSVLSDNITSNLLKNQTDLAIGTYNNVTVNAQGIVTAAENKTYLEALPNNAITTENIASNLPSNVVTTNAAGQVPRSKLPQHLVYTNDNGDGKISTETYFETSGVTAGSYNNVTVDTYGRVTAGENKTYLEALPDNAITTDNIATNHIVQTDATTGKIASTIIPDSGVTAGTYNNVTVNAQGIVTAAESKTYLEALPDNAITTDNIATNLPANVVTSTNGKIDASLIPDEAKGATLTDQSDLTAGTYNNVTVNKQGIVTAAENKTYLEALPDNAITTENIASNLPANVVTSTNGKIASTVIPDSGVTAGSYDNVTVNAQGIVTGGSNNAVTNTASEGSTLTYVTLNSDNKIDSTYLPTDNSGSSGSSTSAFTWRKFSNDVLVCNYLATADATSVATKADDTAPTVDFTFPTGAKVKRMVIHCTMDLLMEEATGVTINVDKNNVFTSGGEVDLTNPLAVTNLPVVQMYNGANQIEKTAVVTVDNDNIVKITAFDTAQYDCFVVIIDYGILG